MVGEELEINVEPLFSADELGKLDGKVILPAIPNGILAQLRGFRDTLLKFEAFQRSGSFNESDSSEFIRGEGYKPFLRSIYSDIDINEEEIQTAVKVELTQFEQTLDPIFW